MKRDLWKKPPKKLWIDLYVEEILDETSKREDNDHEYVLKSEYDKVWKALDVMCDQLDALNIHWPKSIEKLKRIE